MAANEYPNLPLLVARPWANGTSWDIWQSNNCDKCVKEPTCDLIGDAFLHGGLTAETAQRMGWQDDYEVTGQWFCAEKTAVELPPKSAYQEMIAAGVPQLPGFEDS